MNKLFLRALFQLYKLFLFFFKLPNCQLSPLINPPQIKIILLYFDKEYFNDAEFVDFESLIKIKFL